MSFGNKTWKLWLVSMQKCALNHTLQLNKPQSDSVCVYPTPNYLELAFLEFPHFSLFHCNSHQYTLCLLVLCCVILFVLSNWPLDPSFASWEEVTCSPTTRSTEYFTVAAIEGTVGKHWRGEYKLVSSWALHWPCKATVSL